METKTICKKTQLEQRVLDATIAFVRQSLASESVDTGHDWWHIFRVWKMAAYIAQQEKGDPFIVQLAALLHDIADWKFHGGDDKASAKAASLWLQSQNVDTETTQRIYIIINEVTFKGAGVKTKPSTLEGQIVQDADRLDALGAIGIARTFNYGGYTQAPFYDPVIKPVLHASFEEYKNHKGTTINHFYEKLLLLKDLINTTTGKRIAVERHEFMLCYLKQFFAEWNFNDLSPS